MPKAAAAAFVKKGFAGVNSYPEEKRTYPQGTVGSQVVGYAGTDNKGLAGLEVRVRQAPVGAARQADRSSATRSAARST